MCNLFIMLLSLFSLCACECCPETSHAIRSQQCGCESADGNYAADFYPYGAAY